MPKNFLKISVNIIVRNEEEKIKECLLSARLIADEIVLVDMESDDKTVAIAKKYADKIYSYPQVGYVEPARNFGIKKCSGDWVFVLDADERLTPELANEIIATLPKTPEQLGAFAIPRANYNFGVWLKHGGWWPDYQVRLLRKKSFILWPEAIHSFPKFKGEQGMLKNPFKHLANENIEGMVEKTINYSQKEANLLFAGGEKRVSALALVKKMLAEFFRRGIKKKGVLDKTAGIIQGIYQAFAVMCTYIFLWEKQNGQ